MNWRKSGLFASRASIVGASAIDAMHDENLGIFVGLWASALLLLSDRFAEMQE